MSGSSSQLAQWLDLGWSIFAFISAIPLVILSWLSWDRRIVQRRGEPGVAMIDRSELVRWLPTKIFEVKLTVTPNEPGLIDFRCAVRWNEREFDAEAHPRGSRIPVRFRRAPRPLAMPDRQAKLRSD